jgi:hypothetical protein
MHPAQQLGHGPGQVGVVGAGFGDDGPAQPGQLAAQRVRHGRGLEATGQLRRFVVGDTARFE